MTESELLEFLKASSEDAFKELHNRFWKALYIHALKKTGSREDAFDLVQDVFLNLWEKRESLPDISAPFAFYLKGMLVFKLARHFRTKGFQEKHQQDFEAFIRQQDEAETALDLIGQNEEELQYSQLIEVIDQTIEDMPQKMKTIFVMSHNGQYSIAEIAAQLNLSPQTVKNQISNARLRLKKSTALHTLNATQIGLLTWLTIS